MKMMIKVIKAGTMAKWATENQMDMELWPGMMEKSMKVHNNYKCQSI